MNSSKTNIYNPPFSHIYVEKEAYNYAITDEIINRLTANRPESNIVRIDRYMDLFGRTHQCFSTQKQSPAVILAVKHGNFIYPGAPVCQSFGNCHFYYTSFAMNCPFDCEYCFLQGMYPSANLVIFVNLEDYFSELHRLLEQHPVYLCISYDTDLLALERITGFLSHFLKFAASEPELLTEIRTKSAAPLPWDNSLPEELKQRIILAYTLSPETVQQHCEHHTAPLTARFSAIRKAAELGFPIRLCFDPLLYLPDFEQIYSDFCHQTQTALQDISILDASIGCFRISDSYLKQMRKNRPDSALLQFPFENRNHVCDYGHRGKEMIRFVQTQLEQWISKEKIYITDYDEAEK